MRFFRRYTNHSRRRHTTAESKQQKFLYEGEFKPFLKNDVGDAWRIIKLLLTHKMLGYLLSTSMVECEAHDTFSYDAHWGADADGNRGEGRWESDGVEIDGWYIDGREVDRDDIPSYIVNDLEKQAYNDGFEPKEDEGPDEDSGRDR
jgi:hypothetical protein